MGLLHKSECGPGLINLPHVQFFVLFDTLVNLGRSETLGGATFHNSRHLHHLVFPSQITDKGIDLILGANRAAKKIID